MIYHGLALMACAGMGLFGVLYQLHHLAIEGYHDVLRQAPLTPPRSLVERRHLRRPCSDCSMVAELAVAHATAP
jgi:hypothetical protein